MVSRCIRWAVIVILIFSTVIDVQNAQPIEPANRAAVEAVQARKRILARVDTVRNILQAILNIAGRSPEVSNYLQP